MPVRKCSNGKYRIGDGKCIYKSKASAERAYRGYLGSKYANESLLEDREIKDNLDIDGIPINIEFLKGETKQGKNSETGEEWSRRFWVHYGYIVDTTGEDGDSVDVYVKPKMNEGKSVFVIHSLTPDGTAYDEDKVMVGFDNAAQAKKIWELHVHEPENMFGGICEFSNSEFQTVLEKLQSGHRGIIAKPKTFGALKERGYLDNSIESLAFGESIEKDQEYDTGTATQSHIVPSNRYPDHQKGRFGQHTGTPLDNEGEKWGLADQSNPNLNYEIEMPDSGEDDLEPDPEHIGHYGQYQSEPLDHGSEELPPSKMNSVDNNVIPVDFHKEYTRTAGKMFDENPASTEYEVNDISLELDKQEEKIQNWIVQELIKHRVSGGLTEILIAAIEVLNKNQDYIYLKFGKSFTDKEKRKLVADTIRKHKDEL